MSILRQRVAELFRGQPSLPTGGRKDIDDHHCDGVGRIGLNSTEKEHVHRLPHPDGNGGIHDHSTSSDDGGVIQGRVGSGTGDRAHPPPSAASSSPRRVQQLGIRQRNCADSRGERTAAGGDQQQRHHQQYPYQNKEEEEGREQEAVGRVAEMSKRIALRCLDMEKEYLRRERSQTMLFQEQLRGVRQVRDGL